MQEKNINTTMRTIILKEGEKVNIILESESGSIENIDNVYMDYVWDNRPNNIDVRFIINSEDRSTE